MFQEQDAQFRYIALELCAATIHDYVEDNFDRSLIDCTTLLQQMMSGIAHLHSLDIGIISIMNVCKISSYACNFVMFVTTVGHFSWTVLETYSYGGCNICIPLPLYLWDICMLTVDGTFS